jgi:hypothetical protein
MKAQLNWSGCFRARLQLVLWGGSYLVSLSPHRPHSFIELQKTLPALPQLVTNPLHCFLTDGGRVLKTPLQLFFFPCKRGPVGSINFGDLGLAHPIARRALGIVHLSSRQAQATTKQDHKRDKQGATDDADQGQRRQKPET